MLYPIELRAHRVLILEHFAFRLHRQSPAATVDPIAISRNARGCIQFIVLSVCAVSGGSSSSESRALGVSPRHGGATLAGCTERISKWNAPLKFDTSRWR